MPSNRIWWGVLLLLIFLSFGSVAGWQHLEARVTREAARAVEQRARALHAQIARVEVDARDHREREAALRSSLLAMTRASSAAVAVPAPVTPPPQAFDINQMIAERPALKSLYDASAKAAEMESYGWLIVSLTREAADRFSSERLQHDRELSEIGKTSREQGWPREDSRRQALRRVEDERHAREMGEILGAVQLQQYQDYEKTLRERNYVAGELARQLYYTDAPLSSLQAEAITKLVARHGLDAHGRFDFDSVNWAELLREARAQLAPAQFARLENLGEMRRLQTQVIAIERAFGARTDGK